MEGEGIRAFAAARGLEVRDEAEVRELTPGLVGGEARALVEGELAAGLAGRLFVHSGRRESTVVLTHVPESEAYVPALVCRDRESGGGKRPAELPAERWQPVELESVEFNRRYRLLILSGQDPGWVRELFSPGLIGWLAGEAPRGLGFEINEGNLVVALPGDLADAAAVERLCAAAAELAGRIRTEALEEEADPDLFDESEELAAVERALPLVSWARPPASVADSVAAYRAVAARKPSVLWTAMLWAGAAFVVAAGLMTLIAGALIGLAAGLVVAVAVFGVARLSASAHYSWGTASVSRVGLEAFVREYARSRKLELRNRWRFHSEHRRLPLPGFADHVLAGEVPGTNLDGLLVLLGDAAEMRSRGVEIAYIVDRPLASDALVVALDPPPAPEAVAALELPDGYSVEVAGAELCVWRPVTGNLLRTAAGCDEFRERAAAVVAIARGAPRPPEAG